MIADVMVVSLAVTTLLLHAYVYYESCSVSSVHVPLPVVVDVATDYSFVLAVEVVVVVVG